MLFGVERYSLPEKKGSEYRSDRFCYSLLIDLLLDAGHSGLTMKGTRSVECFFSRFAAFLSLGVNKACFFPSLLDRCVLGISLSPVFFGESGSVKRAEILNYEVNYYSSSADIV